MGRHIDIVQRFLKNRAVRIISMLFILSSITSVVLSSFKDFQQYGWLFQSFIHLASLVFLIEYMLRIYSAISGPAGVPQPPEVHFLLLRAGGSGGGHPVCDDLFLLGHRDRPHHHPAVCVRGVQTDTIFDSLPAYPEGDEVSAFRAADGVYRLPDHHLFLRDTGLFRGEGSSARSLQEHRRQYVVGRHHIHHSGLR